MGKYFKNSLKVLFVFLIISYLTANLFALNSDIENSPKIRKLIELDSSISKNLMQKYDIQNDIQILLKESQIIGYEKGIALAYYHEANFQRKVIQNHTKALEFYQKAEDIFSRIPNVEKEIILLTIVKGISLEALGKYDLALVSYHKGLDFYDENKKNTDLKLKKYNAYLYTNIANVHEKIERYDSAEEFYLKALDDFAKENNRNEIANISNNLGFMYLKQKQFTKAKNKFESSLKIFNETKDSSGISDAYTSLGAISFEEKKFMASLAYFKKALDIREKIKDLRKIAQAYYNIAESYKELDSLKQAHIEIEKAIQMAESIESVEDLQVMYKTYSELLEKSKNYEKALTYYKKHRQLTDSLFHLDKQKVIEETTAKYNLDKKEKEIYEMKMRSYILIGASVGILLAFGVALLQYRKKKNVLKLVEQKNKDLAISESNLKDAHNILQEINANLENIVEQKTHEIQLKNQQLEETLHELKVTLENLKIAHKELEFIDKNKSHFLGLLSHNFATPISNIIQAISMINVIIPEENKDENWYKKFNELIIVPLNSASKKLKDRVYLMQTALSLQNKTRPISLELNTINNLNEQLTFIVKQYSDRCKITQLKLESEDLLEIDESLFMEITKIVLNNAEDFSKDIYQIQSNNENTEFELPKINVSTRIEEQFYCIDICDFGRGFSPQALNNFGKLMSPGDELHNLHDGLGLGIFTAKMIMNEHNGEIVAKNNHEKGATVTLKFPKSALSIADL